MGVAVDQEARCWVTIGAPGGAGARTSFLGASMRSTGTAVSDTLHRAMPGLISTVLRRQPLRDVGLAFDLIAIVGSSGYQRSGRWSGYLPVSPALLSRRSQQAAVNLTDRDGGTAHRTKGQIAMVDTVELFDSLRDYYFRYYDTPFALADDRLQAERRALLDCDGVTWREPWLEPLRDYEPGSPLAESFAAAAAPGELEEFVRAGLLPERDIPRLYRHQEEGLTAVLRDRKSLVITAGTGSGKTETFLLPIVASLLEESRGWSGASPAGTDWWSKRGGWSAQREHEHGRDPAVRALVLYPMNALVEDQLVRLRRALDSPAAREWLDQHRGGHRFYFGRYTGQTPVPGDPSSANQRQNLRRYLLDVQARHSRAAQMDDGRGPESKRFYVQSLDGAEMRSRWDMQSHPPDLLITNYVMLNVMLQRRRDAAFFDRTRDWLRSDRRRVFTVVVDELHMYRGTEGTEVAYLIRNLLLRLGLANNREQVRFLAASASLEAQRDKDFLQGFFAESSEAFAVVEGRYGSPPTDTTDLSVHADSLADLADGLADNVRLKDVLRETRADDALLNVCERDGKPSARSLSEIEDALFGGAEPAKRERAMRGLLRGLVDAKDPELSRLRAHLFFRSVPGMWACADPQCTEVPEDGRREDRPVGRLYAQPRYRCPCGGRVLELLYCQTCGEVFLGGHAQPDEENGGWFVYADLADLSRLPDQARLDRNARNYIVYWPRRRTLGVDRGTWERDHGRYSFAFCRSRLDAGQGHLVNTKLGWTGWAFHVTGTESARLDELPAAPTKCPSCGDDWEMFRTKRPVEDRSRMRSPIRSMGTGFEKITQVLTDAMLRQLGDPRKVVLFSDSRQDAAKLSAGLEKAHYQDLVRQLLVGALAEHTDVGRRLALFEAFERGEDFSEPASIARALVLARHPQDAMLLSELARHLPMTPERLAEATRARERIASGRIPLAVLTRGVRDGLLAIGINPGGPDYRLQSYRAGDDRRSWTSLYRFDGELGPKAAEHLDEEGERALERIQRSLREDCLQAIYSGAGRDVESLGVGYVTLDPTHRFSPPSGMSQEIFSEAVLASIRILGQLRRFPGLRWGTTNAPRQLREYWRCVAERHAIDSDAFVESMERALPPTHEEYLLSPEALFLAQGTGLAWACVTCRRQHLHGAAGVCTCQGSREFPRCDHGNSPPVIAPRRAWMASRWARMR